MCTVNFEQKLQVAFTIREKLSFALIFILFDLMSVNCSTEDRGQMIQQNNRLSHEQ